MVFLFSSSVFLRMPAIFPRSFAGQYSGCRFSSPSFAWRADFRVGRMPGLRWVSPVWDASSVFPLHASACPAFLGVSGVQRASAQSGLVSRCAFPPSVKPLWGWLFTGAESVRGCAVLPVCPSTVEPPFPPAPSALPCPELTQPTCHAPGEEQPRSHSSMEFRDE